MLGKKKKERKKTKPKQKTNCKKIIRAWLEQNTVWFFMVPFWSFYFSAFSTPYCMCAPISPLNKNTPLKPSLKPLSYLTPSFSAQTVSGWETLPQFLPSSSHQNSSEVSFSNLLIVWRKSPPPPISILLDCSGEFLFADHCLFLGSTLSGCSPHSLLFFLPHPQVLFDGLLSWFFSTCCPFDW